MYLFNKHYEQIDNYKEHLKEEMIANDKTKFETAFFIEDVTFLGCKSTNNKRIYPIFCDKFIDNFETKENIDYVFSFSELDNDKVVLFTDKNAISDLRENQINVNDVELINWDIQTFMTKI